MEFLIPQTNLSLIKLFKLEQKHIAQTNVSVQLHKMQCSHLAFSFFVNFYLFTINKGPRIYFGVLSSLQLIHGNYVRWFCWCSQVALQAICCCSTETQKDGFFRDSSVTSLAMKNWSIHSIYCVQLPFFDKNSPNFWSNNRLVFLRRQFESSDSYGRPFYSTTINFLRDS